MTERKTLLELVRNIETLTEEQREILVQFFSIKYFERTGQFLEVSNEVE